MSFTGTSCELYPVLCCVVCGGGTLAIAGALLVGCPAVC